MFNVSPLNAVLLSKRDEHEKYLISKLLIIYGANVNKVNEDGTTPLHMCQLRNLGKVALLLKGHGAEVAKGRSSNFNFELYLEGEEK